MFTGASGTVGYSVIGAFRLRKVEMWFIGTSQANGMTQGSLTWLGDRTPHRSLQASATTAIPAHIVGIPPKGSFPSMWFDGTNAVPTYGSASPLMFSVSGPSSTIVDVTLDFTLVDFLAIEENANLTVSGANAGYLYVNLYLDNTSSTLGNGTKNIQIQQVNSALAGYISSW